MKPIEKTIKVLLTLAFVVVIGISLQAQQKRLYFGVEIDGVLCGYGTTDVNNIQYSGTAASFFTDQRSYSKMAIFPKV